MRPMPARHLQRKERPKLLLALQSRDIQPQLSVEQLKRVLTVSIRHNHFGSLSGKQQHRLQHLPSRHLFIWD